MPVFSFWPLAVGIALASFQTVIPRMHVSYGMQAAMSGIPAITRENRVGERVSATLIRSHAHLKPSFRARTLPMESNAIMSGIPTITHEI
jgi:hypothetical protein